MKHLNPAHQACVAEAHRGIPQSTMWACHRATSNVVPDTTLAFIFSEGVAARRVYLQHPNFEQWFALERGGFVEIWDDFGFVMDVLH